MYLPIKNHPVPCTGAVKSKLFTLIELLVVIAIIAILAAMLLPALTQARQRGKSAKCYSHLKTFGTAVQFYTDAYKDVLPMPHNYNVDVEGFVPARNADTKVSYWQDVFRALRLVQAPKIRSWVKVNGLWACPSETEEFNSTAYGYYNNWKGTHYGMNRYLSQKYLSTASSWANLVPRKLSQVVRPSVTFSIADKWCSRLAPTVACQSEMRARYYQMAQRHSGKWNYATLDGGVKSMGNYPKMGASSDYGDWLYAPVKW